MVGKMKATCMVLFATALIVAITPPIEAAIGCGQVTSYLNPCVSYLTDKGSLSGLCCSGIKVLYSGACGLWLSTQDKQSVCGCLKSLAGLYSGANLDKFAALPDQCGVSVPYKISPSTDCSKVQ